MPLICAAVCFHVCSPLGKSPIRPPLRTTNDIGQQHPNLKIGVQNTLKRSKEYVWQSFTRHTVDPMTSEPAEPRD